MVARVYERATNARKAIETNRQILGTDENHEVAIGAWSSCILKTARYPELLGIYQKKLELENDPGRQRAIRYQIAQLYENGSKDPAQAVTAYRAIIDGVGGENELLAWRALDRIHRRRRSGPSCKRRFRRNSS